MLEITPFRDKMTKVFMAVELHNEQLIDVRKLLSLSLSRRDLLDEVSVVMTTLVGNLFDQTTDDLASFLNAGIATVYGRDIKVLLERTGRGRTQTLKIKVSDEGSEPVDPLHSHGGGLAQLIGFILRIVLICNTDARRILILDEPFSSVSSDLLDNLSKLIKDLTDKLGFVVIIVSHQEELASNADVVYKVYAKGKMEVIDVY